MRGITLFVSFILYFMVVQQGDAAWREIGQLTQVENGGADNLLVNLQNPVCPKELKSDFVCKDTTEGNEGCEKACQNLFAPKVDGALTNNEKNIKGECDKSTNSCKCTIETSELCGNCDSNNVLENLSVNVLFDQHSETCNEEQGTCVYTFGSCKVDFNDWLPQQ